MKWRRHTLQSCTVARRNTSLLLRWALHGGDVSTLRPRRDKIYVPSETKFTPQASQNLRPKRTPALKCPHAASACSQITKLCASSQNLFLQHLETNFTTILIHVRCFLSIAKSGRPGSSKNSYVAPTMAADTPLPALLKKRVGGTR